MSEQTWPTQLDSSGKAPSVMQLMGSDDLFLARQAAFLLFTGRSLKESGYQVETFQAPVGGLTVPLIMKNSRGLPAAVYSNSEPWTPDSVAALSKWIAELRAAGVGTNVPVIVVGQEDSAHVSALPDVFQFIHCPQDNLPGSSGG